MIARTPVLFSDLSSCSWSISRDTAEFRLAMGFRYLNFWIKRHLSVVRVFSMRRSIGQATDGITTKTDDG
jgi:hypothetical protein